MTQFNLLDTTKMKWIAVIPTARTPIGVPLGYDRSCRGKKTYGPFSKLHGDTIAVDDSSSKN